MQPRLLGLGELAIRRGATPLNPLLPGSCRGSDPPTPAELSERDRRVASAGELSPTILPGADVRRLPET